MMSSRSSENVINVGWVSIPCVTHQALAASGILPLAALVRRAGCPSAVSAGMRNNRHPCTTRSNTTHCLMSAWRYIWRVTAHGVRLTHPTFNSVDAGELGRYA